MFDNLFCLAFGDVEQEAPRDPSIIFNGLEQFLFMFLAHARQNANLALTGEILHAFEIRNLIGTPDQGDGLRSESLHTQQLQHGRVIFLEKISMQGESPLLHHLLQVDEHAFADSGNGEDLFRLADDFRNLLRQALNGFGGVSVRSDAKRILRINLEQVGSLVQNAGNGFIVHRERLNNPDCKRKAEVCLR